MKASKNNNPKYIYLSHPYGGDPQNLEKCTRLLKELQLKHIKEGFVFISPLHTFGSLYEDMDYEDGLKLCLDLLDLCDEMFVAPGWEHSVGCNREIEYCKEHEIPSSYLENVLKG